MNPSDHSVEDLVDTIEDLQERVSTLEAENQQLREQLDARDEKIDALEARLRQYENPHTPPSKRRQTGSKSDSSDDGDDDARTDGGTVGRNPGHEPAWRPLPEPDEVIEVTADRCPDCGEALGEAVGHTPRYIEEIPEPAPIETTRFDLHEYDCSACDTTVQATHPDCPAEGRFGPRVQALAARARYEDRLPYRKIANRFDQLFDLELSAASAWHATERVARAGRAEYAQLQTQIRNADVVHVDETGFMIDGHQAWLWTFRTAEATLFAIRASRGRAVPAEILGEDFDGTIVCDGWTAYPAFSANLQRCWAHLLREADEVAAENDEAASIADRLHRLYAGLTAFLGTDPAPAARARMRRQARQTLEEVIAEPVDSAAVEKFLGKIESGLDYWLTFVTQPEVEPTNNAAENALREPVVLRKIIGTLRTESGRFTHETLLSLAATWKQQDRNPYEELKRVARPVPT